MAVAHHTCLCAYARVYAGEWGGLIVSPKSLGVTVWSSDISWFSKHKNNSNCDYLMSRSATWQQDHINLKKNKKPPNPSRVGIHYHKKIVWLSIWGTEAESTLMLCINYNSWRGWPLLITITRLAPSVIQHCVLCADGRSNKSFRRLIVIQVAVMNLDKLQQYAEYCLTEAFMFVTDSIISGLWAWFELYQQHQKTPMFIFWVDPKNLKIIYKKYQCQNWVEHSSFFKHYEHIYNFNRSDMVAL